MSNLDSARATQLKNIVSKTGKSLAELQAMIEKSGLNKHSEIRDMLQKELNLGYGDANSLVHFVRKSDGQSAAEGSSLEDVIGEIYSGNKAELRSIHERVMSEINKLGEFEIVPKKGYLSLRRQKQFAMVGPGTRGRLEIGLNMKGVNATERLEGLKPGGMCQYKVFLTGVGEVDEELMGWIKYAYESSG